MDRARRERERGGPYYFTLLGVIDGWDGQDSSAGKKVEIGMGMGGTWCGRGGVMEKGGREGK
jgi:hypothetical protein